MIATARRQAEGILIYVIDRAELYLRVGNGLRQVMLGAYSPFFRDLENEVAEVQPPPVVLYPQSHEQSHNNGAGHYSQSGSAGAPPIEPPPPPQPQPPVERVEPRYPPRYEPSPSLPQPAVPAETSGSALHLIALNTPQSGNMRGIRGADYLCFQQARAVGLKGTFRAFLSSKLQDLYTIVRRGDRDNVPIVNLKNQILFKSWESIFGDDPSTFTENVPVYSFDGRDILRDSAWPEKMIWHGSNSKGHRQTDHYCETWRVGDHTLMGLASPLKGRHLLQQTSSSCSSSYVVLCIENAFSSQSKK